MPRRPGWLYRSEVTKCLRRAFGNDDIIGGIIIPIITVEQSYRRQAAARSP